jgi:hypothetical protein
MLKPLGILLASTLIISSPALAIPVLVVSIVTISQYNAENNNYPETRVKWLKVRTDIIMADKTKTPKQKARLIFDVRLELAEALRKGIENGLMGIYMEPEDKRTIVKGWAKEYDALVSLAFAEFKPYLTQKEKASLQKAEVMVQAVIDKRKREYGF